VSDIQKVLEVCNICYQTQNAALSSKAIEFYTNVAVAYKKSSRYFIALLYFRKERLIYMLLYKM
jgi:hypothetical protein